MKCLKYALSGMAVMGVLFLGTGACVLSLIGLINLYAALGLPNWWDFVAAMGTVLLGMGAAIGIAECIRHH